MNAAAAGTLCETFRRTAARNPQAPALRSHDGRLELTWADYLAKVDTVAAALHGLGVGPGDTLGLMLTNRPEFAVCDVAALHLGAVPFSIYNTSSPQQIRHVLGDCGAQVVITEAAFADRLLEAGARTVLCLDEHPDTLLLSALPAPEFDLEAAWRAVRPQDLGTLIYTSGTTGTSKGVECTHAQLLAGAGAAVVGWAASPGDVALSFLPAAHIAERSLTHYHQMIAGFAVTSVADPRAVGAALPTIRPECFIAVPAVWQRMRAALEVALSADPGLAAAAAAGDPAILLALRTRLGLDRCAFAGSGAAPIPVETLEFFAGLGVPIFEGWGMSEVCGAGIINSPGHNRPGTVGRAVPGAEVRLAEDGELLFRGPQVMRGYRNQPEATAAAVDPEGWLHTGDVAQIDDEGYVRIVDRKKDLIINTAGKNMSPAAIEAAIRSAAPLIAHAVAIGDARSYVTALVVLDPEALAAWARGHGLEETAPKVLCDDPAVRAAIAAYVAAANERLSRVEQVKRFRVLPDVWLPGGPTLTPTMKLRRAAIADAYAIEIADLYAAEPTAAVYSLPGQARA